MHDDRGRESGALGQSDAGRLNEVYAPPRSAAREGERSQADWTIGAAFTAARHAIRSAPLATLIWLGIFPNAWDLPAKVLNRRAQSDSFVLDWGVQLRELGSELGMVTWTTLVVGGGALVALDLMRGRSTSWRRFWEGLRFYPALLLATASLSIFARAAFLPMFAPGGSDSDSWALVTTLATVPGAALLVYAMMVLFLGQYCLVDERRGILDALRHATRLIRGAPARFFGLFFCTSLLTVPAIVAGAYDNVYLETALFALAMPMVWLAWAQPYLASTSTRSEIPTPGVVGVEQ